MSKTRYHEKAFVTRKDLHAFGERLHTQIYAPVADAIAKLDDKLTKLDDKLTQTMRQVANIEAGYVSVVASNCKDHRVFQVGALARTSGAQVEHVSRDKLKSLAEEGIEPYLLFSSPRSRQPITWQTLESVCRYLQIWNSMERSQVLLGVANLLTVESMQTFTMKLLKVLDIPSDVCAKIGFLFSHPSTAATLSRELKSIETRGPVSKDILLIVANFLDLLEHISLEQNQVARKVQYLIEQGLLTLKSRFLFMFFVWVATQDLGRKKEKGEIRSELQIDAEGKCLRRGISFMVAIAEIKSSARELQHAKLQLNTVTAVFQVLVRFVEGNIHVDKIILLYKKEDSKKVVQKGFSIVCVSD